MCCTKDWPFTYNQIILLPFVSESLSPVPRSTWLGGWKQRFQLLLLFEQLLNHPCLKKINVKLWFVICTFGSNHPCLKKINVKLWSLICTLCCCQLLQKLPSRANNRFTSYCSPQPGVVCSVEIGDHRVKTLMSNITWSHNLGLTNGIYHSSNVCQSLPEFQIFRVPFHNH